MNIHHSHLFKRLYPTKEFISAIPYSLLSIGVQEQSKGHGIAGSLITEFERIIKHSDIDKYGLSVYKTNARAIRFYQKQNFLIEGESDRLFHYYKHI